MGLPELSLRLHHADQVLPPHDSLKECGITANVTLTLTTIPLPDPQIARSQRIEPTPSPVSPNHADLNTRGVMDIPPLQAVAVPGHLGDLIPRSRAYFHLLQPPGLLPPPANFGQPHRSCWAGPSSSGPNSGTGLGGNYRTGHVF